MRIDETSEYFINHPEKNPLLQADLDSINPLYKFVSGMHKIKKETQHN